MKGIAGGAQAVTALQSALSAYVQTRLRTLSPTIPLVARFYADLQTFNQSWNDNYSDCEDAGGPDVVMDFAAGFSSTSALVDMINTGRDPSSERTSVSAKIVGA